MSVARRIARSAAVAALALLSVAAGAGGPARAELLTEDYAREGIRIGMERSPDEYICAVVRIASEPVCEGNGADRVCSVRAKVLAPIGAKGTIAALAQKDAEFDLRSSKSSVGTIVVVFAVPMKSHPQIYYATMMGTRPRVDEVDNIRTAFEKLTGTWVDPKAGAPGTSPAPDATSRPEK